MATAVALRMTRRLLERGPVRGRVDRERGIIYGVKLLGRTSPNTHGVRGVNGTVYTDSALDTLLDHAVDGRFNCNRGHPSRSRPNEERDPEVRSAWLENCEVLESGVFGELHFLDPTEPLAIRMMTAAEQNPHAYALSINAVGEGDVQDGRYVVHRITEVRSVDIVLEGGTNRSLFEGREMATTIADYLRQNALGALKAGRRKRLQRIIESLGDTPLREADEKDHYDHMYDAMRACKASGHDDAARGIHKLMHPDGHDLEEEEPEGEKEKEEEEGDGEERHEMEGMGEEGPGEGGAHNEGPDGKGGPATAWESRRRGRTITRPGEVRLTESRAQAMCKTAGIECTQDVLEALKGADFDQALRVLNLAKRSQVPPRASAPPRSSGRVGARIQESGGAVLPAATDIKGWMARLRS